MASDVNPVRCPACGNGFVQPFVCITCGAAKLHDAEMDALRAELAERTRERDALRDKKCIHILAREFLEGSDGK